MNEPTLILYHADCSDGFGAAWSYWKKLKEKAIYQPFDYHDSIPEEVSEQHVVMVDVSAPLEVLEEISKKALSFRLIDHHQAAYDELGTFKEAYFNMHHSGAALAWMDAFPETELPPLIKCIEDRDLLAWKIWGSGDVCHVLDILPLDFEEWDIFNNRLEFEFNTVMKEGALIRKGIESLVNRIIHKATPIVMNDLHGLALNVPNDLASYAGKKLAEKSDFGFTWHMGSPGIAKCSWRSKNHNMIPLAKIFGGGGHTGAGGAKSVPIEKINYLLSGKDPKNIIE